MRDRRSLERAAALLCMCLASAGAGTVNLAVEDYEPAAAPRLGGEAVQAGAKVALSTKEPFQGKQCAELHYVFKQAAGLQYLEVAAPHRLPRRVQKLSVAVRGDGSGEFVRVRLVDATGEWHQFDLGKVEFQGWRVLSAGLDVPHGTWGGDNNKLLDYPLTFHSVLLDSLVKPAEGTVAFDAITTETEGTPEDFVEMRFEPSEPLGYFWGTQNKPSGDLVVTSGLAEPANATLKVRVLDRFEKPAGEPQQVAARVERGTPFRTKLPLQLDRFGVYFVEMKSGESIQRQSLAWLPEAAPTWPESPFGVCTHFGQHKHKVPDTLELIQKMGATWIRDEIGWGGVERKKGEYTFDPYADAYMQAAGKLGMRPFIIFDYGNDLYDKGESPKSPEAIAAFARYCQELMKRYASVCRDWEIWNEPNIFFWRPKPNPEDYAALMKAVYPATKEANPKATIVGACTAGTDFRFIETVLKAGGGKCMDAISVHPYRYPRSPEASDFLGEMQRLKALLDKYEVGHLKVWLTEFGYPTQLDPRGVPQYRSASYLVRTCIHALSLPYVERLFIYDFQDDGTNPKYNEDNFGLIRLDGTPKVAYAAHSTMARMLYRKRFVRTVEAGKDVICYEFEGDKGKVLAAWPKSQAATLSLSATSKEVKATDLMGNSAALAPVDGRITLPLAEEPIFITDYGDVAKADPLIRINGETVGCPGEPLELTVAVASEAKWSVRLPEGWRSESAGDRVAITPPLGAALGDHGITVEAGGVGASATLTLREPLIVTAQPGGPNEALLTVRNPFPRPRKWSAHLQGGRSLADAMDTKGGASTTIQIPLPPPAGEGCLTIPVRVSVAAEFGWRKEAVAMAGLTPCYRMNEVAVDGNLAEWASLKPCLLGEPHQIVSLEGHKWAGAADLTARLWTGWDDERFYLALSVTDDRHVQDEEAEAMWKGDSVQWAITARRAREEFGIALGKDGQARVWQWAPRNGAPEGFKAAARRESSVTAYEIAMPWKTLGISPKADSDLRFALLVNDNDGAGRKGWVEWFQGIGFDKAPAQYGPLELLPSNAK